jgi:hypothetical protein
LGILADGIGNCMDFIALLNIIITRGGKFQENPLLGRVFFNTLPTLLRN